MFFWKLLAHKFYTPIVVFPYSLSSFSFFLKEDEYCVREGNIHTVVSRGKTKKRKDTVVQVFEIPYNVSLKIVVA